MKKHLTDLYIQKAKPPKEGSADIFDLGYPGLYLRVGHGGAKSFGIFYRHGKLVRESLGRWPSTSLAEARDMWRKTREAIAKGETPSRDKESATLFDNVVEEWLRRDQANNKPSSLYQTTRIVEYDLLPAWRGRQITDIGKRDVIALLDAIADRGAQTKARLVHSHLHRFFRWAVSREIIQNHPMTGLERQGSKVTRERVLTDAELSKVWKGAASIPAYGSAIRLLMLTGARREEIGALRWNEIKGDRIELSNGRTKNGVAHVIPLSAPARAILHNVPRIGDYVFTFNGTKPIAAWGRTKADLDKASGVSDWRIHDLRRTVATGMQKLGVTLQVVEAVLGHSGGSRAGIVGVYQRHDYATEKRAALEAWGAHVMGLQK
jgi:integrase